LNCTLKFLEINLLYSSLVTPPTLHSPGAGIHN
jgi:hypothetical protein